MHVYTLLLTSSLKASQGSLKLECRYWMQAYLQVKVGDKSIETHVLIKRDQQSERELHTDARDASAQSQRACFAGKKSLKAAKLRARRGKEEKVWSRKAHKLQNQREASQSNVLYICYFLHPLWPDYVNGINARLKVQTKSSPFFIFFYR